NELQWLSQVMTYVNEDYNPSLIERATDIQQYLAKDTKVRPIHYPLIGFLTIFNVPDKELKKIIELATALEESSPLKWKKEMALSLGIGYVIHELVGKADEAIVSLATSVELLIQAQQAVMVATIAAMAASSSVNSANP
ncbi:DUF4003 family protein, partial [Microvirga sp. 3-52]|nr:DUF4003 family protein [Microvirga sp. 3-52]